MRFQVSGTLLDACVLSVVATRPAYGYELTQKMRSAVDVSESALYPVLRRLLKEQLLESYDIPHEGRNRRYYRITETGKSELKECVTDWADYKRNIDAILLEGEVLI